MKMKMKRLAMTAVLLSSTTMSLADDPSRASVGDLPGFGEDAYFDDGYTFDDVSEAAAPELVDNQYVDLPFVGDSYDVKENTTVLQAGVAEQVPAYQTNNQLEYTPVGISALQPVQYQDEMQQYSGDSGYAPAYGCENGCDGGCNGACRGGCDSASHLRRKCGLRAFDCNTWATYEALLWFPQARKMPVLVASADPGDLPILGPGGGPAPGVTPLFGGEIDGGLSAGFRADYGKWIDKDFGIGGRFWWLGENGQSYSGNDLNGADGSVGRPFFEINPGAPNGVGESALLIAFADADSEFTGDVSAESTLEMLAAEIYGRFRLGSSDSHQLDFIAGYSYFRVDDKLSISSSTTTVVSDPLDPPPGTIRTFSDRFEAENRFNGGQLGFELSATRGCWMVRSLTKVHLGNMQQKYSASGSSTNAIIPNAPAQFDIGMLVQDNNSGTFETDVFAFAPEANFKLAYRFRPNVLLSVGYSFIYFDNLALTGSVIDRNLNGPLLGTGVSGISPAFAYDDSNLWIHGIDLGAVIDF